MVVGGLLTILALLIYLVTQTPRFYDHFVWQAAAFLEGQVAIRHPVPASGDDFGNAFFQDVLPVLSSDGVSRALLPFPPLPALALVPFVAVWGLATDDQTIFTVLAAVDVAICWWMLGRLRLRLSIRVTMAVFFAFGTVFWYAAQLATTWYQAHIVAVGLTLLAVGLAIDADPEARAADAPAVAAVDRRQFVAGLLFGLACTARLTVVFAAPFFLLVGAGGSAWRRGWSAGLGAAIPIGLFLAYNLASTGQLLHPAYDYLYRREAVAYRALGYQPDWAVEDPRYLPQNAAIMFLAMPDLFPTTLPDSLGVRATPVCRESGAQRGLFDVACPLAVPRDIGMSVLLTSPAYLLIGAALRGAERRRLVRAAGLAVLLVVTVNLMHFSQGWVQFGYRFSNDVVPFALILTAIGAERIVGAGRWGAAAVGLLVAASVAVNAWGVAWGGLLGW